MNALVLVSAILGGLSALFVVLAFISDWLVPWIDCLWHHRYSRPQATYRRKQA